MLNKLRIWMTFKLLIKCDETQSKPTQTYSRATVSPSAYTVHGVSNGFPPPSRKASSSLIRQTGQSTCHGLYFTHFNPFFSHCSTFPLSVSFPAFPTSLCPWPRAFSLSPPNSLLTRCSTWVRKIRGTVLLEKHMLK